MISSESPSEKMSCQNLLPYPYWQDIPLCFWREYFFVTFSNEWLAYDAIVHTFFIGFVFSMIFAHGPIILPGVLGSSIKPFHKILYVWLFLLHSSWLLRIFSDAFVNLPLRRMSGAISAIAILAYLITLFLTIANAV